MKCRKTSKPKAPNKFESSKTNFFTLIYVTDMFLSFFFNDLMDLQLFRFWLLSTKTVKLQRENKNGDDQTNEEYE